MGIFSNLRHLFRAEAEYAAHATVDPNSSPHNSGASHSQAEIDAVARRESTTEDDNGIGKSKNVHPSWDERDQDMSMDMDATCGISATEAAINMGAAY
ncbi:hypothetical protein G7K_1228-t1 [Saitoella complicata NRRL Y-17804]|uniref:Uncharacterized protein n=1 Tax=Saitoella complicata (strain BCRC 22490 / CBS 7301 / JCM 7358 / NBRC 10748 / NRRL Y-17804) TaxID=698492 RepID=A0A0E9NB03_SAICN|nr:hypothetical protein G7K_1228-t1 [Saitoella complicata NRRL Y-17804]